MRRSVLPVNVSTEEPMSSCGEKEAREAAEAVESRLGLTTSPPPPMLHTFTHSTSTMLEPELWIRIIEDGSGSSISSESGHGSGSRVLMTKN